MLVSQPESANRHAKFSAASFSLSSLVEVIQRGSFTVPSESQNRARLVATLWNLKQAAKKNPLPGIHYIHFNTLLRQPAYRSEIIEAAANSGVPELEMLAAEASSLNIEEAVLLNPDDKRWLERRDQEMAQAYAEELYQASRSKRRYAILSALTVIGLLVVVSGYFVFQQFGSARVVSEAISGSERWTAGRDILLDGIVTIAQGARLSIDPGVVVRGRPGSALVVMRGVFIHAKGSATQPIVFTSDQLVGKRQPGDWGGVVLLGSAPVNAGQATIEGFPAGDTRGAYGGNDPSHPCGVLEFVRIEFAGFEALADNELNGLTLGGCGSDTVVNSVQVHRALDDGVEVFGGTVNLKRILITQARDDALDWDEGWQGNVQFLVTQQTETGDNAFEGDSSSDTTDLRPFSAPRIFNATLIGSETGAQRAMTLRTGTRGQFANILASSFGLEFADLRGEVTPRAIGTGDLTFDAIVLQGIGNTSDRPFLPETGDRDNDGGFSEAAYFLDGAARVTTRPMLRLPARSQSATQPTFVTSGQPEMAASPIPSGEFWDESARFIGAVRPGESNPWYAGWTEFPAN